MRVMLGRIERMSGALMHDSAMRELVTVAFRNVELVLIGLGLLAALWAMAHYVS
jgi:hypothetical protein